MIHHYYYCGYTIDYRGTERIWGVAVWVDGGFTQYYVFWGSAKNPQIRQYHTACRSKTETISYKIKEKRKQWSGYTELVDEGISKRYPALNSHIGMHVLAKKLKYD